MRATMRIGRGLSLTGGGGVFATVFALATMRGVLLLMLMGIVITLLAVFTLAMTAHRRSSNTRRLLAVQAMAMAVKPDLVHIQGNRSDPPVVGLYVIGSAFVTGRHPRKLIDLERLYPERDLVCVGLFPDTVAANAAKRHFARHEFSANELKTLFLSSRPVSGR